MRLLRHLLGLAFFVTTLFSASNAGAQATCKLNPTNQTVTICEPGNGATVGTTFHVNAGTTDTLPIQYIEVYVHNIRYALQHSNYLDATITVPAGNKLNMVVQAIDSSGKWMYATYYINVSASANYSISPQNPTVSEGATQQFTATSASTWTATCGTITTSGLFTAPLSQPSCKVTGTATSGGGTATTSVTMTSPIKITPSGATTNVGQTQQFSANVAVAWAASCGTIDTSGLFTAPSTPGTCTITATAASGTAYTAQATDTVTSSTTAALNYTTWKNDNARDGWQSKETILTPANVNASNFGMLFKTSVDGYVYAQPLYMSNVTINAAAHNVVYAATEQDTVYAIDGTSGAILWKNHVIPTGEAPATTSAVGGTVAPYIGITGTPVIDPSSGTLYVVSESAISGTYYHRLHALDIVTGAEKFGGPVTITAPGFASNKQLQRPGLLLANGNVYVAFGSNGDDSPYHGFIFSFAAATLQQQAVWNTSPTGNAGAIWMGGAGLAADAAGNIFVSTANGVWNGSTNWGQSLVKLSPSLAVDDYFTPYDHSQESTYDKDLGSAGVLLLPTSSGAYPNEAIQCSKLNWIYVYNRDNLGKLHTNADDVVQIVTGQLGGTSGIQSDDKCFSTPAFWNNNVYFMGNNDALKQFSFDPGTGLISTAPIHADTFVYHFPGGQPVVSSNGNSNAIVWAIDFGTGTLHAYNATNVTQVLYASPNLGSPVKFTVPTVVSGHVYVGVKGAVVGLGLTTNPNTCSIPTSAGVHVCTPVNGGSYASPVTISAAGKAANGTLSRMELWIDGKKINNYYAAQFTASASLTSGSHQVTVVEDDSTGAYIKSPVISITVK